MIFNFKCNNESCENYDVIVERNISSKDLEKQVCEKCNEPIKRIWNTSVSIKTSDGYKY